ncbi:MAG: glycerate kinase [Planctomycetota bacterium]
MKERLRQLFADVLRDLDVGRAMRNAIAAAFAGDEVRRPKLVLALGKAARPMSEALLQALPHCPLRGLVVTPAPDDAPLRPFERIAGGHPLPDAGSLRAGARALELARSVQADEDVLFLVSGGGSSLCEAPLDPHTGVDEVRTLYRALVGCGAPIVAINTVRRHLSALKGGKLAHAAAAAHRRATFVIADVPHEAPAGTIASGPSEAETSTTAAGVAVLYRFALWPAVPLPLRERLRSGALPPPVTMPDLCNSEFVVVQDPHWPLASARRRLLAAGWIVVVDDATDDWPYERAAAHLLQRLERLRRRHPGRTVAVLAGGELSVPLPRDPGTGGRNQQFALACARWIRGRAITVLSCGTDGIDGTSPAAGAVVDGRTMAKARRAGLDVHGALRRCDSFPLLSALGATVVTGPTGTNVRDLRLLVAHG